MTESEALPVVLAMLVSGLIVLWWIRSARGRSRTRPTALLEDGGMTP